MTSRAASTLELPTPVASGELQQVQQWWNAQTVLVTRPIAPNRIATSPHLVVPAEYGWLSFLLSSCEIEAEQLAIDPRVVIQAGDWRGRPALGSRQLYGTVNIVHDRYFAERMRDRMRMKHGARTALARMAHRFAHGTSPYGDLVATVQLHPPRPLMIGS